MRYFSYDSKISQILLKLAGSCYLNMIWFICSLPVFTLGASTTALYYVTLKMARDEDGNLAQMFFRSFRENFRQATALWLIMLGAGLVLAADGYILYNLSHTSTGPAAVLWTLLLALIIAAAVAWTVILLYVFPLTASVVNTNFAMLKNSLFIGARYLFCTILLAVIHFAMFFVAVRLFTPILIFGEGFCAMVGSLLLYRVIDACTQGGAAAEADAAAQDGEADGAKRTPPEEMP